MAVAGGALSVWRHCMDADSGAGMRAIAGRPQPGQAAALALRHLNCMQSDPVNRGRARD